MFTNDCIQGERALPQNLFVACHGRTFLTSLLIQIGQHHVDLREQETFTLRQACKKKGLIFQWKTAGVGLHLWRPLSGWNPFEDCNGIFV